jgi:hypothetical protein
LFAVRKQRREALIVSRIEPELALEVRLAAAEDSRTVSDWVCVTLRAHLEHDRESAAEDVVEVS